MRRRFALFHTLAAATLAGFSALCFTAAKAAPPTSATPPRLSTEEIAGVYAVIQDRPFHDSIYDLDITGVSIRTYWKNIEPRRGEYNWDLFDGVVARAADSGKKVRLCVMFGWGVPDWVGAKWFKGSADSIYDTANVDMPVPWDEDLRREQRILIDAFAARYRDTPHLSFFHISGPSAKWEELALPDNIADQPGFSKGVIMDCWKEIIDQWALVRGAKRLSVAASASTPVYAELGEHIGAYAVGDPANPMDRGLIGSDFCMEWNYLDKQWDQHIRERSALWAPKGHIAWQFWGSTAWPSRLTEDYEGTLRLGMEAGSTYVEVYDDDLQKPELGKIAEQIDREMKDTFKKE